MSEQKRQRGRPYHALVPQNVLLRDGRFSAETRRTLIRNWKLDANKYRKQVEKYAIALMMDHVAGRATDGIPVMPALDRLVALRKFIIWLGENYHINSDAWASQFGVTDIGQFHRLCNALADKLRIATSDTHVPRGKTTARFDECFLVVLAFLHRPSRLSDIAVRVGTAWDGGKISNIINGFTERIADTFGALIEFDHRFFTSRFWVQKATDAFAQKGGQADNVIGFIDGTGQPIALAHYQQMAFHPKKDKCHELRYQVVVLPNGLIASFVGPRKGRTPSSDMRQSGLLKALDACLPKDMAAFVYGDASYQEALPLRHKLKRGTDNHTETGVKQSRSCIQSEWVLGENGTGIKSLCAGLASARPARSQECELANHMVFAVLFQNMILCDNPESNKASNQSLSTTDTLCPCQRLLMYTSTLEHNRIGSNFVVKANESLNREHELTS